MTPQNIKITIFLWSCPCGVKRRPRPHTKVCGRGRSPGS